MATDTPIRAARTLESGTLFPHNLLRIVTKPPHFAP